MQSTGSTDVKTKAAKPARKTRGGVAAKETLHLKSKEAGISSVRSEEEINRMIATAAYFCAQQRHFAPGHELDDWLYAERQIKSQLS